MDIYGTVGHYKDFCWIDTKYRHNRQLELFPPDDPVEFIAFDFLSQLLQTTSDNKHVATTTDL